MKKVILIEDDAAIRESFSLILPSPEFNFTSFDTGEKILQNELEAPDLFIIDKNISGINGVELCRFIKSSSQYKHVCVILLSASPDLGEMAEKGGADSF